MRKEIKFTITPLIICIVLGVVFGFSLPAQIFQEKTWLKEGMAQEGLPIFIKKELPEGLRPVYVPDEIIIKFKSGITEEAMRQFLEENEVLEICESKFAKFKILKITQGKTIEEMVKIFKKNPLLEYAEPNYIAYTSMVPNDPYYQYQWHFDDDHTKNPGGANSNPYGGSNGGGIRMEEAWSLSGGSLGIIVAIVDTGVAYEDLSIPSYELDTVKRGTTTYKKAPDLAQTNFWQNSDEILNNSIDDDNNGYIDDVNGWDFVTYIYKGKTINGDNHPNDNNGHGTHVAGTIAQSTNNAEGVAGISFNATIMPIKVLDHTGSGTYSAVADGIYYATNNGAKIINLSLGGPSSQTLENAVSYAYSKGVTIVAASGNEGASSISYPAAYDDYVIAVGATRYDETRSFYSNYGVSLDLVAPGGDTNIDQNEDGYADGVLQQTFQPYESAASKADPTSFSYWFFQGTSMATPHVSGVAALLLSMKPDLTPDGIKNILQTSAEDKGAVGWDQYYGWGIIDAYAVLASLSVVSITLTTDGLIEFGILPLNSTQDTTSPGINDVETVIIDTGPANLDIRSTIFSDGANIWSLGSSNGVDQVKWEFSPDTSAWNTFLASNTLYNLADNIAEGATQDLYLRLTMPTETSSGNRYSSTVTIVATSP